MTPSRVGQAVNSFRSDYQSNTKNISIKFYEEMLKLFSGKRKA